MQTEPTSTKRLYDRNFALAVISQTCFVAANTLMAHYSRWIDFLGGDLRQVGFVMGFGATLGLVLRPWMAGWIDRLGARKMWGVGYALFAVASLANLLLYELSIWIYLIRSALVLGAAVVFTSGLTYVSQIAPSQRRAEAIGILGVGGFFGMMIGPMLGDMFLAGDDRSRNSFVMFFVIAAIANLIPAVILSFMSTPVPTSGARKISLAEFVGSVRRYWPGSVLLVNLAFGVSITIPFVFMATFLDQAGLEMGRLSVIGVYFFAYTIPAIVIRVLGRRLPERFGNRRILLLGGILMSVGSLLYAIVGTQAWLLLLPAVFCGAAHGLMFHTMTAITLQPFPDQARGTGSALALMTLDCGMIVGAPVLGFIGEAADFNALFCTVGAVCAVATVVFALTSREIGPT